MILIYVVFFLIYINLGEQVSNKKKEEEESGFNIIICNNKK